MLLVYNIHTHINPNWIVWYLLSLNKILRLNYINKIIILKEFYILKFNLTQNKLVKI